jgi:hypothetical protein
MQTSHSLPQFLLKAVAAALILAWPEIGTAETVVTAITGSVKSGDGPVAIHSVVSEKETFDTGTDGHCALMIADEAVVQLCNAATVSISRRGRTRVMELRQGELKATVGPRSADQPLEIHTPVAIASLLGTVVHVSVDPNTGETTITSVEDRVRVQGVEVGRLNPTVLESGQQVSIRRGEGPGEVRRIPDVTSGDVSDCTLSDQALRIMAVAGARSAIAASEIAEIAFLDIPDLSTPAVSAAFERLAQDMEVAGDLTADPGKDSEGVGGCDDPVMCGTDPETAASGTEDGSMPRDPESCGGRKGDHCL